MNVFLSEAFLLDEGCTALFRLARSIALHSCTQKRKVVLLRDELKDCNDPMIESICEGNCVVHENNEKLREFVRENIYSAVVDGEQ